MTNLIGKALTQARASGKMAPTAVALFAALLLSSNGAVAQSSAEGPPTPPLTYLTLPIDMDVRPGSLQFVRADDGNRHLAYNLFVTNWSNWPFRLARVDVEDAATGRVLVSYDSAALENPYRQRATPFSLNPTSPQNRPTIRPKFAFILAIWPIPKSQGL